MATFIVNLKAMMGKLTIDQIEEVLKKQIIGRIGCHADDTTYIVPVSYAYDGTYVYAHTYEGLKMQLMRKNPKVCFQVDIMENMANWQSVICFGQFEEVTDPSQRLDAIEHLMHRRLPYITSQTVHLTPHWPFQTNEVSKVDGIIFRIRLIEKSGRFEMTIPEHFYAS